MPTPIPTPTDDEIVIVAEIAMLTVSEVSAMVAAESDQSISNALWDRTLTDIDLWDAGLVNESGNIKQVVDVVEFFEGTEISARLAFRNKIRRRYGYSDLASEIVSEFELVTTGAWF